LHGRAEALESAARTERTSRARAVARRQRRVREGRTAEAVATATGFVLARLDESLHEATSVRSTVERDRAEREQRLAVSRSTLRTLDARLDELTDAVHRDEMARAEQRMRIEQLERRAIDELGLPVDILVGEYGPDQLVPASPAAADEEREDEPDPVPYYREQQQTRLRQAERQLAMLGKINPLALEEFSALEERHQFLGEQLDDLKQTRRDLLDIVREVDDRVEQVFTEAFLDVEREFQLMFARLFPGGEGRLVLSDPSNMLSSGIEVEARPPGKRIKRLSLLSGGERALVAVAFLVALFKARPSPFYILDEVEAALDETNLGRLLEIYEELRENSQLVVITHQKRTMEVADALYGISMRGDGVSAVISQRLREAASA
jgi:chromosome segregation protein